MGTKLRRPALTLTTVATLAVGSISAANAASGEGNSNECRGLPSYSELKEALTAARLQPNGGLRRS